jgi:hypothetical protein
MAPTCNPTYSGGRNQENHILKPAQRNTSQDLISKQPFKKRAGGVAQSVSLDCKPQFCAPPHKKVLKIEQKADIVILSIYFS